MLPASSRGKENDRRNLTEITNGKRDRRRDYLGSVSGERRGERRSYSPKRGREADGKALLSVNFEIEKKRGDKKESNLPKILTQERKRGLEFSNNIALFTEWERRKMVAVEAEKKGGKMACQKLTQWRKKRKTIRTASRSDRKARQIIPSAGNGKRRNRAKLFCCRKKNDCLHQSKKTLKSTEEEKEKILLFFFKQRRKENPQHHENASKEFAFLHFTADKKKNSTKYLLNRIGN